MTTEGTEVKPKEVVSLETTPEVKTPTAEEQLKTLTTQLETLSLENEKLQKQYKGLQGTVNEKSEQIRKQANIDSRIDAMNERMELIAAAIASGRMTEEEMATQPKEVRNQFLDQLKTLKQNEDARKRQAELDAKQRDYSEKADAIYSEAETVLGDDIDALASVRQLLRQGDLDLAEKKIKKVKPMEDKKESEDDRVKRLVAEGIQAERQSKGLLKTDSVVPSGATKQEAQIRLAYQTNPTDPKAREDYLRWRREKHI